MAMHLIAAVPMFLGIPAAAFASSRRSHRRGEPAWALYSAATAVSVLTTMGLAGAGLVQVPKLVDLAGLLQRAAIVMGVCWLTAISARALR
jgi:hypothetical protein